MGGNLGQGGVGRRNYIGATHFRASSKLSKTLVSRVKLPLNLCVCPSGTQKMPEGNRISAAFIWAFAVLRTALECQQCEDT